MKQERKKKSVIVDIEMHEKKPEEKLPDVAMYLLSPAGAVLKKLAVVKKGKLELQEDWKKLGRVVALGPDVDEPQMIPIENLLQFRLENIWPQWKEKELIDIVRDKWSKWIQQRICVSGNVKRCLPPWLPFPHPPVFPPPMPQICRPVCNGVVEIYERTCCSYPYEIDKVFDERIPWEVICEKLGIYCPKFPPDIEVGPLKEGPFPDGPMPIDRNVLRKIKLAQVQTDPAVLFPPSDRLVRDIQVLKKLKHVDAIEYIKARPYLTSIITTCTTRKLGEAVLGPDGSFTFCYWRPLILSSIPTVLKKTCNVTFAYKVKQWQENQWVYIYNGLETSEYFSREDIADLHTSWLARACETDPQPVDYPIKPFVLLQDIGSTNSHRLISPLQNSVSGINIALPSNGGLVDPPPAGRTSKWQTNDSIPYNCPWSGTLNLRLYVHPEMQGLGAKYYRISIVAADAQGNPVAGTIPKPLSNPVSWRRFDYVNGEIQVKGEALGPHAITDSNGVVQSGLYIIPYWDKNHQWLHGQFHQFWDTMKVANGRHLVILEIFNNAGKRLRPSGAVGDGVATNFDFLHWDDPVHTSPVPYASLVLLFWTDKQNCYADIEDLRIDGIKNAEECQFMRGSADSTFSTAFRAFHPHGPSGETFMWYYKLWYHRGLNGANGTIQISGDNAPSTLGAGNPEVSTTKTFGSMLDSHAKCTFALNLRVKTKHTNGSGRLLSYEGYDQAAFALEIGE